jgi:hypothetical protein
MSDIAVRGTIRSRARSQRIALIAALLLLAFPLAFTATQHCSTYPAAFSGEFGTAFQKERVICERERLGSFVLRRVSRWLVLP